MAVAVMVMVLALQLAVQGPPQAQASLVTLSRTQTDSTRSSTTSSEVWAFVMGFTPTEGNTLIAMIGTFPNVASAKPITSITQAGVTWTEATPHAVDGTQLTTAELWIGVVGAGASTSITITGTAGMGASGRIASIIAEYGGRLIVDQAGKTDSDATSPLNSPSLTTTAWPEVAVVCFNGYWVTAGMGAPSDSYTTIATVGNYDTYARIQGAEKFFQTTKGATSTSATMASAGNGCVAMITLKIDPASPPAGSYSYTLSSIYEDGTALATVNVQATDSQGVNTVAVTTAPMTYYFTSPVSLLSWTCGAFTRTLHPESGGTYKIIVQPGGATLAVYQFNVKDYSGVLTDPSYLQYYRVVSGTSYLVGDMEIGDAINGIPLIWIYSAVYEVKVKTSSATYSQGWLLAGDDYSINVLLKELNFSESAILSYKYVTVEATRPNSTQIVVQWNNTLTTDYNITAGTIYVNYRNGTQATNSSIGTTQAGSFTWNSAVNVTDYKVHIDISHQYLGAVDYEKVLSGVLATATDFPSLDVFGTIGDSSTAQQLLAVASMFVIAGAVSFASVPLGALSVVALGGFYSYRGVLPITSGFLWTVIGLVGLIFLASRRGG